jgi:N-acetylglucosaminyldiphosphoundecaprenol N-acetyl-beta-D-mannosaminyltransferase
VSNLEWTKILGCPITKLSLDDCVNKAQEFIASGMPHYIAVVNVAKVVGMRVDNELRESVLKADIIGADGVPLVWVSHLLGNSLPGRVNGTDLMYKLMEKSDKEGYGVFFFGAAENILDRVIKKVRQDYPNLRIAGFRNGYFTPQEEQEIVRRIRESKADILFIAFGTPKKELWVKRYLADMDVPVVHGVGGSFDVLAGAVPRAPIWMQRSGLEWLFRLLQEPGRMWRRYLVTNTIFAFLVLVEWLRVRLGKSTTQVEELRRS